MPGKPQIWYLDLFAGKNDHEAMRRAGPGGHKEINRTNLSPAEAEAALNKGVVLDQLALLRMRNTCPVFREGAQIGFRTEGSRITIQWKNDAGTAALEADLDSAAFTAVTWDAQGGETFRMER